MDSLRFLIRENIERILKENDNLSLPENSEMFYEISNDLIWVRVLNSNFFFNKECDGQNFGIGCQMSVAKELCGGKSGVETYQLLKKFKRDDSDCFKVLGAVTLNVPGKFFIEFRQRGNQPPGSNSVEGISKEEMVDYFLDLFTNKLTDIDKFSDATSLHIPSGSDLSSDGSPRTGHGWAAKSLWYIMKNYPTKFSKYMNQVPGVFVNQISMIEKTLGEDFLLMDKGVEDIFKENKYQFFNMIDRLLLIKKEDVLDFLKKLNFEELLKDPKILKSIENKLFVYIDFLSPQNIEYIIKKFDVREFIKSSVSNFGALCRKLSEKGGAYKKVLYSFVDDNFLKIIDALGGKGIGVGRLMVILNSPKYKKHENAKINTDTGDYEYEEIVNRDTGEKIKKSISDENLVFSNSERKKLLEKHKEKIKSFFNLPGQNSEIEFIRFLIPNLPEGSSKYVLEKAKDDFIAYYDKKFDDNKQDFPGKFLYNILMNQLKFRLGEKEKKLNYNWEEIYPFHFKKSFPFRDNKMIFPSEINYNDRFDKKTLQSIIKYFYKKLKPQFGDYKLNSETGGFSFVPKPGKSDEIKQVFSDYLYLLAVLSSFDQDSIKNWLTVLGNNKFPIVSPSPAVVSWAKNKNFFEK
jgi:hypothetical protein